MADRTLPVAAGPGLIMVCVNSGIDGDVQAELTVTLTAIEGKASEYPTHYVCHACIFVTTLHSRYAVQKHVIIFGPSTSFLTVQRNQRISHLLTHQR